jgi:hypothetical protein
MSGFVACGGPRPGQPRPRPRGSLIGDSELAIDPAPFRPPPKVSSEIRPESGPVMVSIQYIIESAPPPNSSVRFNRWAKSGSVTERFSGAVFDAAQPERFVEYYVVESWFEHLRQHERGVIADLEVEKRVKSFHVGTSPQVVAHLVSAKSVAELDEEFFTQASAPEALRTGQAWICKAQSIRKAF